jgi:hypothetical protein
MNMATITATKNYSLFELCEFNRDVVKTKNLMALMKEQGWIDAYPMHVIRNGNGKLRIKAGHHRFEVARILGIAVKYVVCEDTATIHQLEGATVPWTLKHYFMSFSRQGRPEYLAVKEYMERTGISLGQAVSLLGGESAGSANRNRAFKDGEYRLADDRSHADAVAEIIIACRSCNAPCATARDFVHAVSRVLFVPEFDIQTFICRARTNASLLTKQVGVDAYGDLIEYVYNYRSPHKVALAFPAKQLAKARASFTK